MVLSYTTSPAYHLIAEEDDSKSAAAFDEGHYMQVEVAAKLASTDQPELADEFLQFMVSDAFQSIIPTTNWMYPAVEPEAGLPEGFETLISPQKALLFSPQEAADLRDEALAEWLRALSQ
jgi:thiamine transport system substrate-binding protein